MPISAGNRGANTIMGATQILCKLYVNNKLVIVLHTDVPWSKHSLIPRLSYVAKDS